MLRGRCSHTRPETNDERPHVGSGDIVGIEQANHDYSSEDIVTMKRKNCHWYLAPPMRINVELAINGQYAIGRVDSVSLHATLVVQWKWPVNNYASIDVLLTHNKYPIGPDQRWLGDHKRMSEMCHNRGSCYRSSNYDSWVGWCVWTGNRSWSQWLSHGRREEGYCE